MAAIRLNRLKTERLVERDGGLHMAQRIQFELFIAVLLRHILPPIVSPVIILSTLDTGNAILTFASLSFLGLGPTPDVPEWGSMVAAGRTYFDQWWIGTFPGLAISSIVLSFNVVGDSLRDFLDPRYRKG